MPSLPTFCICKEDYCRMNSIVEAGKKKVWLSLVAARQ
jgi:hypothetical protein